MNIKEFIKEKEAASQAKELEKMRKRQQEEADAAAFDYASIVGEKDKENYVSKEGIFCLVLIVVSVIVGFVTKRPEIGLGILFVAGCILGAGHGIAKFMGRKL